MSALIVSLEDTVLLNEMAERVGISLQQATRLVAELGDMPAKQMLRIVWLASKLHDDGERRVERKR